MKRGLFIRLSEEERRTLLTKMIFREIPNLSNDIVRDIVNLVPLNIQYNIKLYKNENEFKNLKANTSKGVFYYHELMKWGFSISKTPINGNLDFRYYLNIYIGGN